MNNENLINQLSSELKPVKKLLPVKWRVLVWTGLNILISLLIMQIVSPLSIEALYKFQSLELTFEILLQFSTVAVLIYGAFASIIPGAMNEKKLKYFFTAPVLLYLYFLVKYFFQTSFPVEYTHRDTCYKEIIFISIVPFFHSLFLIFKAELWNKYYSFAFSINAATLLLSSIMYINCMHAVDHSIYYHLFPGLIVTVVTILILFGFEKIKRRS